MGFFERFLKDSEKQDVSWNMLESSAGVDLVMLASHQRPQLVLKHSPRCGTSFFIKRSLDAIHQKLNEHADLHLIDVIHNRSVSMYFAEKVGIRHQSPQVFILRNETVVWHNSHYGITEEQVLSALI